MDTSRSEWTAKKVDLALKLSRGECGGAYGEAILILSAVLSALAADIWPGARIDRKRFVELLVQYASSTAAPTQISIPVLAAELRASNRMVELHALQTRYLNFGYSRVLTGNEVDQPEGEVLATIPSLARPTIRACSYANLLYREARSAYTHEYRAGARADSWHMTSASGALVSYTNRVGEEDRYIHFHVSWLAELAVSASRKLDANAIHSPLANSAQWWLDA